MALHNVLHALYTGLRLNQHLRCQAHPSHTISLFFHPEPCMAGGFYDYSGSDNDYYGAAGIKSVSPFVIGATVPVVMGVHIISGWSGCFVGDTGVH